MFTLQISAAANQLKDAGVSDSVVDTLMDLLGNCSQTLVHRGPITVSVDMPKAEFPPDAAITSDYPPAAFTAQSNGSYNPTTGLIEGGFSARFDGPVYFSGPIISNSASSTGLAKAQGNWEKSLAEVSLVPVRSVSSLGGLAESGPVFNLYLPHTIPGDPNVIAGMVLTYGLNNGVAICTSPYMDAKIGTVRLWCLAEGGIPAGWKRMDGTANTDDSGYNLTGKFVKGAGTVGDTGGDTNYTPIGTISGTSSGTTDDFSPSVTVTVDPYNYTGTTTVSLDLDLSALVSDAIIISSHIEHHHHVEYIGADVDAGGMSIRVLDSSIVAHTPGNYHPTTEDYDAGHAFTHRDHKNTTNPGDEIIATFTGASSFSTTADFDLSDWDHTHTASGVCDAHGHGYSIDGADFIFTGESATIEPPYLELFYIERIDNSA